MTGKQRTGTKGGGKPAASASTKSRKGSSFPDPFLMVEGEDPKAHEAFLSRIRRLANTVSQTLVSGVGRVSGWV